MSFPFAQFDSSPSFWRGVGGLEPTSPFAEATALRFANARLTWKQRLDLRGRVTFKPLDDAPPDSLIYQWGRGGGKTDNGALEGLFRFLARDHDRFAAAGSRIFMLVVAPTLKQSREDAAVIRRLLDSLAPVGLRYEARGTDQPEFVIVSPQFRCERVIRTVAADEGNVRGPATCVLLMDEAQDIPHASEIYAAVRARMNAQFEQAVTLVAGTPGSPSGLFYDLCTRPPRGAMVVQAPTWVANPRITRDACWRAAAGDRHTFEKELEAKVFGFNGERFLDGSALAGCVKRELSLGPRRGYFHGSLDFAPTTDGTGIVFTSAYYEDVPGVGPIRFVRVEHAELLQGTKSQPLLARVVAQRVAALARAYASPEGQPARIRHDIFVGHELQAALREYGVISEIVPMDPTAQTSRWLRVKDYVNGKRLVIPAQFDALVKSLGALTATEMARGTLKVEGKADDLSDAFALCLESSNTSAVSEGGVFLTQSATGHFDLESGAVTGFERRWWKRLPDGRVVPAEPPYMSTDWLDWMERMVATGTYTASIERYLREQQAEQEMLRRRGFSVPVLDNE